MASHVPEHPAVLCLKSYAMGALFFGVNVVPIVSQYLGHLLR
jgi:hypothetical protein